MDLPPPQNNDAGTVPVQMTSAINMSGMGGNMSENCVVGGDPTGDPRNNNNNIVDPNAGGGTCAPSGPSGPSPNISLDSDTISQLVSGLHQAAASGSTKLPSRDISMDQTTVAQDPSVHQNYIPPVQPDASRGDYISTEQSAANYDKTQNTSCYMRGVDCGGYEQIQTPVLIMVLYFLFQLPFFRNTLYAKLPGLFSNDGNYNINGFVFNSVLFGLLFYTITQVIASIDAC